MGPERIFDTGLFSIAAENSGGILWLAFSAAIIFFAFYSFIFLYHWIRYGAGHALVWGAAAVYFAGSSVLISALLDAVVRLT